MRVAPHHGTTAHAICARADIAPLVAAFIPITSKTIEEFIVGALPKKRVSNARQGNRRAHHKVKIPQLTICPNCRQARLSHHACPNCGMYRGRQVFEVGKSRTAE
jgi:large subunit ribosomal protein L32